VEDGVLYIKPLQCFTGGFDVYANMGTIKSVVLSGSGNIVGGTLITSDDLSLAVSGSGKILAGVQAKKLTVSASGSGESTLIGTADEFIYESSGSGKLSAYKLNAAKAKVMLSGSGDAEVTAQEALDVIISGSGEVHYKGSPAVNKKVSGGGRLVKEN